MSIPLLHPETTDDPRLLKWSIGTRVLPTVPPPLLALIDEGVLARVEAVPGEVRTWLGANRSWSAEGPRVRSLLFDALSATDDRGGDLSDAELLDAVKDILRQEVAPVAESHGGEVTALSVDDGILTVEFDGACHGCAASGKTLSDLVAQSVRSRYPQITEVRAATPKRAWLPLSRRAQS